MARKMTEWPSKCWPITKIMQSDGCGGKSNTTGAQFEYDRHESEGYLGNVGAYLAFAETPDVWVWLGAMVIFGSTVFVVRHEARASAHDASSPTKAG